MTSRKVPGGSPMHAAFAFVLVTVLLDFVAIGIALPVLPRLVVEFERGDVAHAARVVGMYVLTGAAMQFAFSPLAGLLSDRVGRRPILLLSNLGLGCDYIILALAPNLTWLFIGRVISGITAATFPIANAYVADVSPPEKQPARFGMLGAVLGLGFIIGPGLGGSLGGLSLRVPFWVAAALSLTNAAYGFFVLPESLPPERRSNVSWRRANPLASLSFIGARKSLVPLLGSTLLHFLAHESILSCFVLYGAYRYGWSEQRTGLALTLTGLSVAIGMGAIIGPLTKKLGERATALVAIASGAVAFSVFGLAPVGAGVLAGLPFLAVFGTAGPTLAALITARAGPDERGHMLGMVESTRGLSGMIGPLLFTQSFALAISPRTPIPFPGLPYFIASLLLIVGWFWLWSVRDQKKPSFDIGNLSNSK